MRHRFFLGGHDLEMEEIRSLLAEAGLADAVVDRGLAWGAKAAAYEGPIRAALSNRETPVLIELEDDLPADIDRDQIFQVDHHGARAGADKPSALRQVYDLIREGRDLRWTRRRALVAANDIDHVRGLRALGATAAEVRAIRDADRRAQGIDDAIERESRRAIDAAERHGELTLIRTSAPTSSAIADFLLPEYGGPGVDDLVVEMPGKLAFFGRGAIIEMLKDVRGCWYGGALPERGYWGAPVSGKDADVLIERIAARLDRSRQLARPPSVVAAGKRA